VQKELGGLVTNHRWFRCFENIDVIDVSLDVSAPLPYPVYVEKAVNVQVPVHVDRPYPVYVKAPVVSHSVVKHAPSIAVSSYPISGIGHSAIGHDASVYADHHGYHKYADGRTAPDRKRAIPLERPGADFLEMSRRRNLETYLITIFPTLLRLPSPPEQTRKLTT